MLVWILISVSSGLKNSGTTTVVASFPTQLDCIKADVQLSKVEANLKTVCIQANIVVTK